jgi:hypothetical protein
MIKTVRRMTYRRKQNHRSCLWNNHLKKIQGLALLVERIAEHAVEQPCASVQGRLCRWMERCRPVAMAQVKAQLASWDRCLEEHLQRSIVLASQHFDIELVQDP